MSHRSASIVTSVLAIIVIAIAILLLGCAARPPATPSIATTYHAQHLSVTLRAKDFPKLDFSRLVSIKIDGERPDGFTISADIKTLLIETRLKGMEQEEGNATISLIDSRGASASVTIEIPGGRKR